MVYTDASPLTLPAQPPNTPRGLSVVIITQDEAERTARAIASCQSFADEVVVIDGGSQDNTAQVARQLGARVFVNAWPGYAAQRQFGVAQTQHPWVFMLDSDEVVGPDLAQALLQWKRHVLSSSAFRVDRANDFMGRWMPHHTDDQVRLFNKHEVKLSNALVHEGADVARSQTEKLTGTLWHYKFRSLEDQIQRVNHYTSLEAQRDYAAGQRFSLVRLLLKPPARFVQRYVVRRFCTRGLAGFVHSALWGSYDFLKEVKLYEINRTTHK